ncbi:MAG TPA: glycosyltransferase [Planctomycetota bacterium]|nr:glycosyltransferase [Planctomycetota bacterium]
MKILHVITTLDVGGAEVHLLSQVRGQSRRGHTIRVLYLKGEGSLADELRGAGAGFVARAGPLALLRSIRWADLVHSHLLKADMTTALLATLAGKRASLVASKHNDEQVLKRPLVSRVHGWLGNLPVRTIVLSDHVGRFVQEHGRLRAARIRRIYYGIDPTPFAAAAAAARADPTARNALRATFGFAPTDVVFICVARFAPQKAHGDLLRALAEVADPRVRLLLVGDDPFGNGRREAEALARELGLGPRAVFAGIRRDVPELVAMSDGFVMSSLWEGLGLVFLEAMAAELPVLATRVSAVPEVVIDGETGILVPPHDPPALARALARLAADPALRERLGRAGAARVQERFALERMVEETLAVYGEVKSPSDLVR